jgi:NADP-dependent 3-hydroxy acid dehydrogenase YdfG
MKEETECLYPCQKKLENRVAVITGVTSGMALATAKLFVEEGVYVFITGRSQKA